MDIKTERERQAYISKKMMEVKRAEADLKRIREKNTKLINAAKNLDLTKYDIYSNQKKWYPKTVSTCWYCGNLITNKGDYWDPTEYKCREGKFWISIDPEKKRDERCPLPNFDGEGLRSDHICSCDECMFQDKDTCIHPFNVKKTFKTISDSMDDKELMKNLEKFQSGEIFSERYPENRRLLDTSRIPLWCPLEDYKEMK